MARRPLRSGYTTGACAAAAALGAARMLRDQRRHDQVTLTLPAGVEATFPLCGQQFTTARASCWVVKDAGDDPDVTHGCELHAAVTLRPPAAPVAEGSWPGVLIEGGAGIGRVTRPGLAVPVGDWAINPVPRRMIREALLSVFPPHASALIPHVLLSIPDGAERARRTLNARLGILGGLSLLGTTGIVTPLSHQAWAETLGTALEVARAAGCSLVAGATGKTSEQAARTVYGLPEQGVVLMGDFVGAFLDHCHRLGWRRIVLVAQFAKLVKLAAGHLQTHVASARLELRELAAWGREGGLDRSICERIECANTAREVWQTLAERSRLAEIVARRCLRQAGLRVPGAELEILLVDYDGSPYRRFRADGAA